MSDDKMEQHKMDRRKKRTSSSQYMMYIEMMEQDSIFATGRIPRDGDANYLVKKWKELSDKLNTCSSGPTLKAEEWRKRLNDWKNTTRCKYRRSVSGEKDITMTPLELKALDLFGKVPSVNMPSEQISIKLKCEKEDDDIEQQRASETFQKELQAAVEEAIGGDDEDDALTDELDENEEVLPHSPPNVVTSNNSSGVGQGTTTYRTIVMENNSYADDDNNNDSVEYITHRRHTTTGTVATAIQTVGTAAPATTVTKLINGEIPLKRLRTQAPEIIYEVKKAPITQMHTTQLSAPRNITIHNTSVPSVSHQSHINSSESVNSPIISSADARELSRQIKRLADIKAEKLRFEVARFKFNNPGFHFNTAPL